MVKEDKYPHLQLIANIIKRYKYGDLDGIIMGNDFQMLNNFNYEDKYGWDIKEWYSHLIKMFEHYEYFEICRFLKHYYKFKTNKEINE